MSGGAIEITGVTVRYRDVLALDDVSLTVAPGRVTALIGMNGSGKSTLFKSITGLVRPDAGTVLLAGGSPAAARRRGLVGYVPQSEDVDWTFPVSVRDVVMMGRYGRLGITRRPRAADRAAVDEALERVELTDLADRQIGALSGGQRKRAFVARGIAQDAGILLLDEPFAGIQARARPENRAGSLNPRPRRVRFTAAATAPAPDCRRRSPPPPHHASPPRPRRSARRRRR